MTGRKVQFSAVYYEKEDAGETRGREDVSIPFGAEDADDNSDDDKGMLSVLSKLDV